MRTEGREHFEQGGADQSGAEADCTANQTVPHEIQGLEVVTGRYVTLLEASLVLADDVQEGIPYANRVQIV
jgi:hypothetical protein